MKLSQEEVRQRFKERGLKLTPQRVAIYRALAETTNHPTASHLHKQVKRLHPMISPNTVYYTLATLQNVGLVQEVNACHDRARFDANVSAHHHLICLECQSIQDFTNAALDDVVASSGIPSDFQITRHRVEFHGYCESCRKKKKSRRSMTLPILSHAQKKRRES